MMTKMTNRLRLSGISSRRRRSSSVGGGHRISEIASRAALS